HGEPARRRDAAHPAGPGRLRRVRLRRRGVQRARLSGRNRLDFAPAAVGTAVLVRGHVFVVGADLTRLSCDDVLVPTDRRLRVAASWLPLLPADAVAQRDDDAACLRGGWSGAERVREVPGCGDRRAWRGGTGAGDGAADGG